MFFYGIFPPKQSSPAPEKGLESTTAARMQHHTSSSGAFSSQEQRTAMCVMASTATQARSALPATDANVGIDADTETRSHATTPGFFYRAEMVPGRRFLSLNHCADGCLVFIRRPTLARTYRDTSHPTSVRGDMVWCLSETLVSRRTIHRSVPPSPALWPPPPPPPAPRFAIIVYDYAASPRLNRRWPNRCL